MMRSSEATNRAKIPDAIELYTKTLEARGYRPSVVGVYRAVVEHFIACTAAGSDRVEISKTAVRLFLDHHLVECNCHGRVQRSVISARAALNHLLTIFGKTKLPSEPAISAPIEAELRRYGDYARDVCGLAPATLISRRQWIGRFLSHLFPQGRSGVARLRPHHVLDFFRAQCRGYRAGTAQVIACAIRSYMRFRALQNGDRPESLVAAVPSAACWHLSALPKYLNAEELTRLMAGFDRTQVQQLRDYAMVRCLADLGLRSCEVAALRLEDLDWKAGTLTICAGKSQRSDVLPLPFVTGEAIAEYLCKGRPATGSRAVFVRHRAPRFTPVNTSVIRSAVRQAAVRSGLADRLRSPHQLRHSAAARMLHGGATLKEIADVLRHRSLDTTAIYAKVDVNRLAVLAQPWPGGVA
jgi:integrase/recombinase XerD